MGNQLARHKKVEDEKQQLRDLEASDGTAFPGSDFTCAGGAEERKRWMEKHLDPAATRLCDVVWPGTHDSATNAMGVPCVTRPLARCQSCGVYKQLCVGTRVLDLRVEKNLRICHGILKGCPLSSVVDEIRRFLKDTEKEIVIVEVRTEYGHDDPPDMEAWLRTHFGEENLIPPEPSSLRRPLAELLPRRIVCIWKPQKASDAASAGGPLWRGDAIRDNWIDTDLPMTKFENNLKTLAQQQPAAQGGFFYRVENTVTPQADNPVVCVWPVTKRIHCHSRLFLSQVFKRGIADRLQVFSTDFIDADFVDACIGINIARASSGKAAPT